MKNDSVTSRRSCARTSVSFDIAGLGEEDLDRERRPADSLDMARSKAPGRLVSLFASFLGDPLRLVGKDVLGDVVVGEGTLLEEDATGFSVRGNHFECREGRMGTVIRAWITCVSGGARGDGNVGGSELNSLSRGGSNLKLA